MLDAQYFGPVAFRGLEKPRYVDVAAIGRHVIGPAVWRCRESGRGRGGVKSWESENLRPPAVVAPPRGFNFSGFRVSAAPGDGARSYRRLLQPPENVRYRPGTDVPEVGYSHRPPSSCVAAQASGKAILNGPNNANGRYE
jgi:hypothetical protein